MKIFHFSFLYIRKQVPVPIVTTMWSLFSYKLTNADLNSSDSNLSSDLPEAGKTDTDTEDEYWNLSNRLEKQSIKKKKVKVGQRLKEKCVNNETIKKRKNDSKLKRKTPPQKISKKDSVPQEHARMMQPSQQISNCSKETIDTTPIFHMNAVNEHHIIQSVKEVSEQQAENTSNVSATVVKGDCLLAANGLVRKEVAADGNCFFKAALLHVRNEKDLRQTYVNI